MAAIPAQYRETIVTPKQSRNIEAIWSYVASKRGTTTILPDGRCDIILRLNINGSGAIIPIVTGPATHPYAVSVSPDEAWVGIRLRPDQGASIWDSDIKFAKNKILRGACAIDKIPMLASVIRAEHNIPSVKAALVEIPMLAQPTVSNIETVQAIEYIHTTGGRLRVSALAKFLSCSTRQLNRVFHTSVGITAKSYCSLVQFHRTLRLIENESLSLSETAFEAGYADQAHMARTVKKFSGFAPSQLPFDLTTPNLFS